MPRSLLLVLAATVFASVNPPLVFFLQPPAGQSQPSLADKNLPVVQSGAPARNPGNAAPVKQAKNPNQPLTPSSELAIVRFVDGEFAKVVRPLPAEKKGFAIEAGKPLNDQRLQRSLANSGAAAHPGDTVQITRIQFKPEQIVVEINGGAHKHRPWRERIHIDVSGGTIPTATMTPTTPGVQPVPGATLILDYGRSVPDMSPDDLKKELAAFLDFSKERSPAVNWVDTLPPEFKKGIQERKAVVGMDRDMVEAALGRPDHKVREKDPQGDDTEDWIYGQPPAKTVFVTFIGDKVVRVREFQ